MRQVLGILFFFILILFGKTYAEENSKKKEGNFIQNAFFTYENDSVYGKDRYYTNGAQFFFLTRDTETKNENKFLSTIFNIKNKSFHNYSFAIGQKIYTPSDIETKELLPYDRPYAGYLYAYLNKNIRHKNKTDAVGLSIGLTGPSSLAEQVQTNVHKLIGSTIPEGWDNQLSNEFLFMINWLRVVELHESKPYSYDYKLMPKFAVNLGTPFTGATIGIEYRYGWNLDDDLVQNSLKPSPMGIRKINKDLSYYAFIEAEGNLVLYNTFLDGNISGYKPDIEKNNFTYNISAGLTLRLQNFYVKYSSIYESKEFKEQDKSQFIFSLTAGFLF